jgi:hypothetical protein
MARPALLALALVVVFAFSAPVPVGGAPPAANAGPSASLATDGPPVGNPGGPARMQVGPRELERTSTGTAGPRLGSTVSLSTAEFGSRMAGLSTQYRFDASAGLSERRSLVDRSLIRLGDRSSALVATQRAAILAYANGSIDQRTLLVRLAEVHRTAEVLEPRLDRLRRLAQRADARYYETSILRIGGTLRTLQGPVRERVATALAAEEPLPRVSVEAAGTAVVLSYVDGEAYVRESYFLDNRRTNGTRNLATIGQAADRAREYYPWVYDNQAGNSGIGGNLPAGTFRLSVPHTKGELTAFLDAGTGDVFKESQRLRLSALDPDPRTTATDDGLRVVLNATYPGGPMRVELYDDATGERVAGQLRLEGRNYSVPADESLWVVEPRGAYDGTVQTADGVVNVSVPAETVRSRRLPVAQSAD